MNGRSNELVLEKSALTDKVYELLKARIIDLDLAPGARLHADRLGAELDVSPTPVREALNRLAAEGIVTVAPYRGFRVSPLLDQADLARLLHARRVLECAAAEQTATVRDDAALRALSTLVGSMDELVAGHELDVKAFNAADAAFHRLTVAASGNRFMVQALDSLHVHVQIARHYQGRSVTEARRANAEHHLLLAALLAGDAVGARDRAAEHIDGGLARLNADAPREDVQA
jgi:DNA-binding GntR family transcriptional regulator